LKSLSIRNKVAHKTDHSQDVDVETSDPQALVSSSVNCPDPNLEKLTSEIGKLIYHKAGACFPLFTPCGSLGQELPVILERLEGFVPQ